MSACRLDPSLWLIYKNTLNIKGCDFYTSTTSYISDNSGIVPPPNLERTVTNAWTLDCSMHPHCILINHHVLNALRIASPRGSSLISLRWYHNNITLRSCNHWLVFNIADIIVILLLQLRRVESHWKGHWKGHLRERSLERSLEGSLEVSLEESLEGSIEWSLEGSLLLRAPCQ